jgi:hypothetical protein
MRAASAGLCCSGGCLFAACRLSVMLLWHEL